MRRVQLFGMLSLVLMLWVFNVEVLAFSCAYQPPNQYAYCADAREATFCDEHGDEPGVLYSECDDGCENEFGEMFNVVTNAYCDETEFPTDWLHCVCYLGEGA